MSGPEVFGSNPYAVNRSLSGEIVTVLRGVSDHRGLKLEGYRSRAVQAGQIHELMCTDAAGVAPDDIVDRVALLGFFEISRSGVLLVGSRVMVGEYELGAIAGFNDTHMPNHQNICLRTASLTDGVQLGLSLGDLIRFD